MKRLNRKNLPKWTKPLLSDDIRHIQESGGLRIETVKRNEEFQKGQEFPCLDCLRIAQVLRENGVIK